jgi:hypothetical protein
MGGGGFKAPSISSAWKAFKSDPVEWNRLQLDPGGLFGASKNDTFAGVQGMIDVGGIGAKGKLEERTTNKAIEQAQQEAMAKQQAILDKQTDAQSAALTRKRKLASGGGHMSLLSGSMLGTDEKTTLG